MGECNILQCKCLCFQIAMRHAITMLCLMLVIVVYGQRVVFHIAITEITNKKQKPPTCPQAKENGTKQHIGGGKRDWDEGEQALLLYSFYVGYLPLHLAGVLCDRYGARWPMILSVAASSISIAAMPLCLQHLHLYFSVALRTMVGIGQGAIFPAITSLLSHWAPPAERATLGALVYAGNAIGSILGIGSGAMIGFVGEWHSVFYMWAAIGVVWIIVFFFYGYSKPADHKFITEDELAYLTAAIPPKSYMPLPLKGILLDTAVWATILGQIGHGYVIFFLTTNMAKYMNQVLGYKIKSNALISSLPFIFQYLTGFLSGEIADRLIKKKNANVYLMRVSFTVFAGILPCACLLALGYSRCNRTLAVVFYGLALFFKGPFFSGLKVNTMDISMRHAGFLMALSNGLGSIGGIVGPLIVGWIAKDNTHEQWDIIFLLMMIVTIITLILYAAMASGHRRKFDYTPEEWDARPEMRKCKWYKQYPDDVFEAKRAKLKALADARKAARG